jgi:hypothetical protein
MVINFSLLNDRFSLRSSFYSNSTVKGQESDQGDVYTDFHIKIPISNEYFLCIHVQYHVFYFVYFHCILFIYPYFYFYAVCTCILPPVCTWLCIQHTTRLWIKCTGCNTHFSNQTALQKLTWHKWNDRQREPSVN